jgi:diphosphomevalonate decarboxylase
MGKASAIASSNIALVKYWGKRDKELMLPHNGSLSMTLDGLTTHTTVEFDRKYKEDVLIINGSEIKKGTEDYDDYVGRFLGILRKKYGVKLFAKMVSKNNYPTAAGLASSASGMAALATAAAAAAGLKLDRRELSILARYGSGSACRSIDGGFVEWTRGTKADGSDSFGRQIYPKEHWPELRMVIAVTSKKSKKVKSRAGMAKSVENCPYYRTWAYEIAPKDIETIKKAIKENDFALLGKTAELNCLKMHATALTTDPPILYWNAGTVDVMHAVMDWRDSGLVCYFTIDGGPQVKILCLEKDAAEIAKRLKSFDTVEDVIVTRAGDGASLAENHLF